MLKEKIKSDYIAAMKSKSEAEISILKMAIAAILNKEKEKQYNAAKAGEGQKTELTDEEIVDAISSEIKKLRDSVRLFEQGKRDDLAAKSQNEIAILSRYLPAQLGEEAVKELVAAAVKKTGASSTKEMSKVMAELMPEIKGKADGSMVSRLVKEALNH